MDQPAGQLRFGRIVSSTVIRVEMSELGVHGSASLASISSSESGS